ncbi:WYL domain-containing protein [Cytobacillus sp. S13-E01]|uniref:helix-turn-helix transcriptional regulator n=1 Tax=Cytobacillus sp. S13-E01 TaxID=3031326 RepID=UPI0023D82AB1|nr:WYL domain-containing protein [Cytobacillus sp. S13-E01]MDF0728930.1 WYL domain-containing protein [Cytobacillus sp. S13-E01]
MVEVSNIKRLMAIREILFKMTDEEHYLSLIEIINQLKYYFGDDIKTSKNTIRQTIEELKDSGFNVEEEVRENNTVYYSHQYRKFEVHELRLLIDAVSSARFIPNEVSNKLISKVKSLTSKHLAKRLRNQIIVDKAVRAESKEVKYHIDKIHTSINERKLLTFKYGRYNLKKDFVLSHNERLYTVKPLALVWNSDYYYLVAKPEGSEEIKHYRVDRMRRVSIKEVVSPDIKFNIAEHLNRSFNMYPGEVDYVEILFSNQLINVVLDRFGRDININIVDEEKFTIKISASISEGLIRWLLTWGSDAKVISPPALVQKLKEEAEKMYIQYS